MEIKIQKKFLKELAKIPKKERQKIEDFVFEESAAMNSLEEAGIFEKMKGYRYYYKARFGSYRVGVRYEDNILIFERVLHRKEIYRYFP